MKVAGGGSTIKKSKAKKIASEALSTRHTKPTAAGRSKALVVSGNKTYRKVTAQAVSAKPPKVGRAKANAYLAKSSGTTKKEVQGVRAALKTGRISAKQAVKALSGGPTAGVAASKVNVRKVRKALSAPKGGKVRRKYGK